MGNSRKSNFKESRMPKLLLMFFPFLRWFDNYSKSDLRADLISGTTVALVLIPQSMAYAQLAGLPAYYGLYAAFLPPMISALFGSSNQLATGPVAMVSLMTATALEPLATAGSEAFIGYAILLALMVGVFQFALGALRLGLVVNFLSHPVVNGFTNAAAIIIATSQLSKIFGVHVDKAEHHYETVINVIKAAAVSTHWPTFLLAVLAFAIMAGLKKLNPKIPNVLVAVVITTLISWGIGFNNNRQVDLNRIESDEVKTDIKNFNEILKEIDAKAGERIELNAKIQEMKNTGIPESVEITELHYRVTILNLELEGLKEKTRDLRAKLRQYRFESAIQADGTLKFYLKGQSPPDQKSGGAKWKLLVGNKQIDESALPFAGGGEVVATIPRGLPKMAFPKIDLNVMLSLLSMSVIISLLGFMEAISIAKAMAAKTGQRLDPNQELIGQGLANIVGSMGQSYAVSGSFSRSAINIQAGAVTGLSNVFSSCIVIATLMFFTPLLYHLPQSVLAAIIMMAVVGLVNVRGFIHAWQAQKYDGVIGIITFMTTLAFAPHLDKGIIIGVLLSLILYLLRNMKPDIAILSKTPDGSFRNAERHSLEQCRHIAVIRFNGSLFFASVNFLEDQILEKVSEMPELKHILVVGNGINELDASGEEMLSIMVERLRESGYDISFSGLNDAVLDTMVRTHLYEKIGEDHFFRSVAMALDSIHDPTHADDTGEDTCPLVDICFKGFPVSSETRRRELIVRGPKDKTADKTEEEKNEE